jgi:hypothetical protein
MILTSVAKAQMTDGEKSMIGIRRVGVVVDISPNVPSLTGVTEDVVEALVTKQLGRAGLSPVSESESKKELGKPVIYVGIYAIETIKTVGLVDRSVQLLIIRLTLAQEVIPVRRKTLIVSRTTWLTESTVQFWDKTDYDFRKSLIIAGVDNVLVKFTSAYQKANPPL